MSSEKPDLVWENDPPDRENTESDRFDKVRRGFAPDQVAEYLKRVATSVLTLETRLEETRTELFEARRERDATLAQVASSRQDPYDDVSGRVTELLRSFDRQVGQLQREAEAEADRVLSEVRTDADRILAHAHEDAERTLTDARREADRMNAEAREEAEHLITQAKEEANRAESDLAAIRESTLDTFRDIHRRALAALAEVQAKVDTGAEPDHVVIVDEADEPAATRVAPIPRPDL
jgi:cell division septum initiation protein DivIVA